VSTAARTKAATAGDRLVSAGPGDGLVPVQGLVKGELFHVGRAVAPAGDIRPGLTVCIRYFNYLLRYRFSGSRGIPRMRSAMTFLPISVVPPAMVIDRPYR
jgi:hypothetical protein